MADMSVNVAGVAFKNPIITASGTFGFGREYAELYELSRLGGVACKGITAQPRLGNPPPRIAETPGGILNSVGLQNPGVDKFIKFSLKWLLEQNTAVIANVAGFSMEEYCEIAEKLDDTDIHMIELNISCPNVHHGGATFGTSCQSAAEITSAVRAKTKKPLMVKLTPNVTSISEIARAVESAGADAVSLINTITGMQIDIDTRRPILQNNTGGLSGPCVLPVAVRMVSEVYRAVKIPIVGMGGVSSYKDAAQLMLAGAAAVQVGTYNFTNPMGAVEIADDLAAYCEHAGLSSVSSLTGKLELY